jgi:hypothetical protein
MKVGCDSTDHSFRFARVRGSDSYRNPPEPIAETAQAKTQPPFDIVMNKVFRVYVVEF